MLPEKEQILASEIIRRMVIAWDPDFTKLTESERADLERAENDEFIDSNDIDWDNLDAVV
jgi:hypothetical protein